jgi:hypothetical protein
MKLLGKGGVNMAFAAGTAAGGFQMTSPAILVLFVLLVIITVTFAW